MDLLSIEFFDRAMRALCASVRKSEKSSSQPSVAGERPDMSQPIILCDIDGVIADCSHRLHFIGANPGKCEYVPNDAPVDWDAFFAACTDDEPIKHVIRFLQHLQGYFDIAYITGRPERSRKPTLAWFEKHRVPFVDSITLMLMRADGNHRQDNIVKKELFREFVNQTRVVAVIENRDQVVEMWRAEGLLCLQPKKGDY